MLNWGMGQNINMSAFVHFMRALHRACYVYFYVCMHVYIIYIYIEKCHVSRKTKREEN